MNAQEMFETWNNMHDSGLYEQDLKATPAWADGKAWDYQPQINE